MKNLFRTIFAGFLAAGFAAAACAGAMDDLGAPRQAVAPAVSPGPAQRMPDADPFAYFGRHKVVKGVESFGAVKGVRSKGAQDAVASVDLQSIRNAYLKPNVSFTTGAGTKVYVSGTKAANCPDGGNSCAERDKFLLVLTTDKDQSFFVRAIDVVSWGIFMNGSKELTIDGEKYQIKVYAELSAPENSKLEIKGPRGMALSTNLKAIADAVAAKGVDVRMSRRYKLAYGNEILQGPQGGRFTSRMLILLVPAPVVVDGGSYVLHAADIKPEGTTYTTFERDYSFRLLGGRLDIYRN